MNFETAGIPYTPITHKEMRALFLRPRRRDAHKGDFGRVLIVAGSRGMAGAAVLCARAALRAGSGLVTVSVPDELFPILQTAVPEAMCRGRDFAADIPADILHGFDAIALGPGMGTDETSCALVSHIIENYSGKLILDADALNIFAREGIGGAAGSKISPRGLWKLPRVAVLTPHVGEAGRLLGLSAEAVQADRAAAHSALQKKFGCAVVLKGAGTLVSPNRINTTGNPGMATGGSGDVLTGVITSFGGQGFSPETAAAAGVYVHGLAGDLKAEELGQAGLIAGDIVDGVTAAIRRLRS